MAKGSTRRRLDRQQQEVFFSNMCNLQQQSARALAKHLRDDHDNEGVAICGVCHLVCPTCSELKDHMEQAHRGNQANRCFICGEAFKDIEKCMKHLLAFH